MKKKVFVLMLTLCLVAILAACGCDHEWNAANCTDPKTCVLCNETQGEALGHKWVDATCTDPKKCSVCHLTEGNALEHDWQDATTEAPKTCANCQATEGSRIITDPRFTTEATKDLYGTWSCEQVYTAEMMGTEGYLDELSCTLYYEFTNTGELIGTVEIHDRDAYLDATKKMTRDVMLETLAYQGISESQADDAMKAAYGMTLDEYVAAYIDSIDLDDIFGATAFDGVYYVGQNGLYSSDSWYGEFECEAYTLEGDTLTIELAEPMDGQQTLVLKKVK